MKLENVIKILIAILYLVSPIDILNEKVPKYTRLNHINRKLEENDNYIIVKYGNQTTYNAGQFKNVNRQGVDYIKYKGEEVDLAKQFKIEENGIIHIYFSESVVSLKKFFYDSNDPNVEYISSIDLTHFDSSSLESLERAFYGCISLELIDLSTFTAPSLTNMAQSFFHCSSLKALDLSKIISSSITNTNRMFCGCESLLYINMNNLDLSHVNDTTYMFYNMKEINYLEIKGLKVNDKINDELKGEYGLNDKDNLIVCKNEENLSIEKYHSSCCNYDIELKKCQNYIICKYNVTVEYKNGFQNKNRQNISFIKNGNSIVGPNEKLIIEANTSIEIYFSIPINNMNSFFSGVDDSNVQDITSIDFSHFDSSSVNFTWGLFYQCYSLEEINFGKFDTSRVTDMQNMFRQCHQLKSLDLSSFDTSKVTTFANMFAMCFSLEYLDISNFNISQNTDDANAGIFNDTNYLKYINLYNAQIENDAIITQMKNKTKDSTIVCQKVEFLSGLRNNCVIFHQTDNYIKVKYGAQVEYNFNSRFSHQFRTKIQYIKYEGNIVDLNNFIIKENGTIEIYLPKDIDNLARFFSADEHFDTNSKKIVSIDFSHFDSSSVEVTNYLFYECSSLEEINFNHFNTSKIAFMSSMFYGCSNLKSLDLSNFDTSNVDDMEDLFNGCTSLEYLDISYFNTSKATSINNMFNNVNSLKYINLYNAQINNDIKSQIQNILKDTTIVCQKDDIIINKTYIKACCEYNDNILKCYSKNYITVHFNKEITYENGFKINNTNFPEYRKGINFIKNEENITTPSENLVIKSDSKIEIHLDNSIKSLAHFFNSDYDANTKDIISIDFSHFNSSLITEMNSLFSGCGALQQLYLNNFIINSETLMDNIFSGCDNLKYLDISGFNITSYDIFNGLSNLEFINIYNAQNYDIDAINNITKDLNICQKEKSIQNLNIKNKCGYYNINNRKFESTNLIIIYFNKDVEYKSGFINGIESRNNIDFLINGDKINVNESFSINKGKKIEIYLNEKTTSLKSFFNSDLDSNMLYIISIDFTFFDSSKVTNMENLFKGCNELVEIDFTNFNTSLVINMGSMFSGCSNLIELDMSSFDTSSVIDMHDMFYGCTQLKLIDLYDSKMGKIITAHNIFKNNDNLKYIDLLKVKDSYINITESQINRKNDLIICQNDNIIINTNATYKCCYYNTEK